MVAQIDARFAIARPWKIWPRLLAYTLFEGRPLTSRGRWINPLVFAGFRLWSVLPLRYRDMRPIFIYGVGRSGTTVLGTILALHRNVGYLNEPKALWQAALGDDDLIGSYSTTPGRYKMSREDLQARQVKCLGRFYRAFLGLSFTSRVVDKYPELLFRNGLIDAAFPDARKIILLRNGADICRSIENWSREHGDQQADWWGRNGQKWQLLINELVAPDPWFAGALPAIQAITRDVDRAAMEWIVTMREAMRLGADGDQNLLFIRYEDLLRDPGRILANILNFCDLSNDRVMLDYGVQILRPGSNHSSPNLIPELQPLFDQTMRDLGYDPQPTS